MTGAPEDLGRALLLAGVVLLLGARFAVRTAMPPRRGRHRRKRGSPRTRAGRPDPVPVAGGATGLLESIPYLEPVRSGRRLRSTGRLAAGITLAAAAVAGIIFVLASRVSDWLVGAGL